MGRDLGEPGESSNLPRKSCDVGRLAVASQLTRGLQIKFRLRFGGGKNLDNFPAVRFWSMHKFASSQRGCCGHDYTLPFLFEREMIGTPIPIDKEHVAEPYLFCHAQIGERAHDKLLNCAFQVPRSALSIRAFH